MRMPSGSSFQNSNLDTCIKSRRRREVFAPRPIMLLRPSMEFSTIKGMLKLGFLILHDLTNWCRMQKNTPIQLRPAWASKPLPFLGHHIRFIVLVWMLHPIRQRGCPKSHPQKSTWTFYMVMLEFQFCRIFLTRLSLIIARHTLLKADWAWIR